MKQRTGERLLSLLLAAVMTLGLMPTVGATEGEEPTSTQFITAFEDLGEEVAAQEVELGTAEDELSLPATLNATVDSTPTTIDVTWASEDYDGETAATYVFTAEISSEYTLAEGVTLPTITITVMDATAEPQAQTVIITIEEDENETSALYLTEGVTVTEDDLLAGVSAADEQGNPVEVTLGDLGGLDVSDPQRPDGPAYPATPYTLTYKAVHPITGEAFTAAREAYVTTGAIMPLAEAGDFKITGDNDSGYNYASNVLTISGNGTYTISMASGKTITTTDRIAVQGGVTANITLNNVNINTSGGSAFAIANNSTVNLTLSGDNILKSGYGCAGLQTDSSATLNINADSANDKLEATGGNLGAGIGGGDWGAGGTIQISGGTITAYGKEGGAGIGGSWLGAGGTVNISGGTVSANGSFNAFIGSGSAGIGGGGMGDGGTIEISGGTVIANGDSDGAGIGGGYLGAGGTIKISKGGTITAYGGVFAPNDIGYGVSGSGISDSIEITGGSVNATSVAPQPTNGSVNVYLNTLTVGISPVASTAITAGSVDGVSMDTDPDALNGYGINDVYTDASGKVYFWLPESIGNELVTITANSATYGAYFARSNSATQILYKPFTVSFKTDGGSSVADQSIYYGGKVSSVASPTKDGYSFVGWYSDDRYSTPWDFSTDIVTEDMILYAAWEENDDPSTTYTITFDANSGSVASETMQTGTDGKLSTLPTPTRSGYSFTGWYTQAKDGAQITTDTVFTENTTVYAQWTYNGSNRSSSSSSSTSYYTLSFEENGGSVIASISRASDTRIDLSEYKPTRDGYTFTGWYSDSTLTTKVTSVTLTKNTTVYAGWELKEEKDGIIHQPYISGYTDGTFRPDSSITRAETAQLLYNISGKTAAGLNKFNDVSSDKWYYNAVTSLTNSGIISGYTDGTFKPVNSITRAEFVALAIRYAGKTETSGSSFSDVSSDHCAAGYIAAATQAGYISGYTDGTFRPDAAITRAEAVTVLNAMMGREIDKAVLSSLTMPFSDVPTSHWAYYQILEAAVEHEHDAIK